MHDAPNQPSRYEKPTITTQRGSEILAALGPATANVSGGPSLSPGDPGLITFTVGGSGKTLSGR